MFSCCSDKILMIFKTQLLHSFSLTAAVAVYKLAGKNIEIKGYGKLIGC